MNKIFIILFLLTLVSCKKEMKKAIVEKDDKIVVLSFMSPQQSRITVELSVAMSNYAAGKKIDVNTLKNSIVEISDGSVARSLSWSGVRNVFQISSSQLPIVEGKTYKLSVSTPDGSKLTAQTTIPSLAPDATFEFTKTEGGPRAVPKYFFVGNLIDIKSEINYYRVGIYNYSSVNTQTDVFAEDYVSDNYDQIDVINFKLNFSSFSVESGESGLQIENITRDFYEFMRCNRYYLI